MGPFFSLILMRKQLSSGQKWFLRPFFPLIRGMFVFRSGFRFERHSKARRDIKARMLRPRDTHVNRPKTNLKARILRPRETLPCTRRDRQKLGYMEKMEKKGEIRQSVERPKHT